MNRNICRAADPTVSMCGFQNYHSLYKERTATEITEVNTGIRRGAGGLLVNIQIFICIDSNLHITPS